nr:uncharacterized mitochondrial protein AtMg00810-like [Tanacetum cinerariifolium]
IDTLTQSMNYQPVVVWNQPNSSAGIQENLDADANAAFDDKESESKVYVSLSSSDTPKKHDEKAKREAKGKSPVELSTGVRDLSNEFEEFSDHHTNRVNAASAPVTTIGPNSTNNTNSLSAVGPSNTTVSPFFEIGGKSSFVDLSQYHNDLNMPTLEDIIYLDDEEDVGAEADFLNLETTPQTRSMARMVKEQGGLTQINDEDFHTCGASSIQDAKGLGIKLDLLHMDILKEGIDYDEVFAPIARIEAIRLFLAYDSFMGFMVYQMDVKRAFLYGTIKEEVYVCQPPRFKDPVYLDKVYKVFKALYGLHQAPTAWNFGLTDGKSASTPIDTEKPLLKDPNREDVDVHIYRSMIGSLMYLTSSRPDIMFAICECAHFQVTPKVSLLHAVKRIFRYLKSKPHLGLWYPKDSPFNLVAYSDSDYARASLDRKTTTRGCQFL